jgi:hypothetical protein
MLGIYSFNSCLDSNVFITTVLRIFRFLKLINIRIFFILFYLNTLQFANSYKDSNSRKLFVDDSRKTIPYLNTMIIITNETEIGKDKEYESILNDLVFKNEIFRNFKDNVITEMKNKVPKNKVNNLIRDYIGEIISGKDRRKVYDAMNKLDIIVNLIIEKKHLKIKLINRKGDRIGLYKKTWDETIDYIGDVNSEHIEREVNNIYYGFMD